MLENTVHGSFFFDKKNTVPVEKRSRISWLLDQPNGT